MTSPLLTDQVRRIGSLLMSRSETIAVAESSTGGLISASLLSLPGASAYFQGGSVIYTLASRRELLRITADDVAGLLPLSEPMVQRFARHTRDQLGTTWGLAELGAAGPTGARYGHPAGTCVLAVHGPVNVSITVQTGSDDREKNMWTFASRALTLLEHALAQHDGSVG